MLTFNNNYSESGTITAADTDEGGTYKNGFVRSAAASLSGASAQFPATGNWFGSASYYHSPYHSYHHHHHPYQHQQHTIQDPSQGPDQNCVSHNWPSYPHHPPSSGAQLYANYEWIPPQLTTPTPAPHCLGGGSSEYSAEESSDCISPSPISNRTVSPAYGSIQPNPMAGLGLLKAKNPYDWMKKSSASNHSDSGSSGKTRTKDKYRVVYTDQQRLELEKEFHFAKYITIRRKTELAAFLGLSERQVKIWFQNRRAKERKQAKKRQEMQCKVEPADAAISCSSDRLNHLTLL